MKQMLVRGFRLRFYEEEGQKEEEKEKEDEHSRFSVYKPIFYS